MEYSTHEKQALDILRRTDFKSIKKDEMMSITSMLSNLRPEVALEAIKQFPELSKLLQVSINKYKGILDKVIESDDASIHQVYDAANKAIAEDKPGFIEGYLKGKRIRDFRDDRGNMMQDHVLRERLAAYDSRISDVYNKASSYVHFSDTAFYSSVRALDNYRIEFSIGLPLKEEANTTLLEGADVFIHYTFVEYRLLQAVVESKRRVDNCPEPKE